MYKLKQQETKAIYKSLGFTLESLASSTGIKENTLKSWFRKDGNERNPDSENLKKLIKVLKCSIDDIADLDTEFKKMTTIKPTLRPLIGSASCGVPTTYYYDDDVEMVEAPNGTGERAYYVKADGDSMTPRINNGDLILCDPDAEIVSGNIVHFEWDGEHGVKRYVEQSGTRMMVAINSEYPPILITDEFELRMSRCIKVVSDL